MRMGGNIRRRPAPQGVFLCCVTDRQPPPFDVEEEVAGGRVRFEALDLRPGDGFARAARADALHVWGMPLTAADLPAMPRLKAVVRMGVGHDNVDVAACAARGVTVAVVPDYGVDEVADLAFGHILSLNRDLRAQTEDFLARGRFEPFAWGGSFRLRGKTLGIVGFGRIGSAVGLRARGFGLDVIFYDPHLPDGVEKSHHARRAETLGALLEASDIVSIHCPLTHETRGMFDAAAFARLRPGALLVNTARGPIVDPAALFEAARSGRLGGFGFDVYATEPPDPGDPFIRFLRDPAARGRFRVSATHHSGFHTVEALRELRRKATAETLRILAGGRPRNPVKPG